MDTQEPGEADTQSIHVVELSYKYIHIYIIYIHVTACK